MKIVRTLHSAALRRAPLYVALGFFDGMHRGHQKVIQAAVSRARREGGRSCVLTFAEHPMMVLAPERVPIMITPGRQRTDLIAELGVDICILLPFSRALSLLEPAAFVALLAATMPNLREAFVGVNWRFGYKASGDSRLFKALGHQQGFAVTRVKPVLHRGSPVSSTRIRESMQKGQFLETLEMLGRPFSIGGKVQHDQGIGRTLGFPTANIRPPYDLALPQGVYTAYARINHSLLPAVVNFGVKPTVAGNKPSEPQFEVHILNRTNNLYGKALDVYLLHRLRSERRFPSTDMLRRQIARDVKKTEEWLLTFKNRTLQSFKLRIIVRPNKMMRKEK